MKFKKKLLNEIENSPKIKTILLKLCFVRKFLNKIKINLSCSDLNGFFLAIRVA